MFDRKVRHFHRIEVNRKDGIVRLTSVTRRRFRSDLVKIIHEVDLTKIVCVEDLQAEVLGIEIDSIFGSTEEVYYE